MTTYQELKEQFSKDFSLGYINKDSYKAKRELEHLICYLTSVLIHKDPIKYGSVDKVLAAILNKPELNMEDHYDRFLAALAIRCDDLLFGMLTPQDQIEKPEGYTNSKDIIKRIRELLETWTPF